MRKLELLLGGALVLAGCAARTPPPPPDMNNTLLAPGFLAHAGSANQFELQSAQLAVPLFLTARNSVSRARR